MDGSAPEHEFRLDGPALDRLMPMHLCLSPTGHISACGPTLRKLVPDGRLVGHGFFDLFEIRRPGNISGIAQLRGRAGSRIYLSLRGQPMPGLRGVATPMADGQGMLLNLSFGIGIVDAVRNHGLTNGDFAPTDLAVELLYLVEAKSAVMEELRQLNLRLQGAKTAAEEQALTDTLTGLRNRRAFDIGLDRVIGSRIPFGLMHMDLDFFKTVNDTLGHAAGDHVLRQVGQVLCSETRANDLVARVGGDEFVIILPGLDDPLRLSGIADRMIAKLSEPMQFDGQPCLISASIGMTMSTFYTTPSPQQMIGDADLSLYASKHAGRGRARMHQTDHQRALPTPLPMRAG